MKRYLGPLALLTALAVLTGCGDDPDDRADDPAPQEQTDEAAPRVVDILSASAARGDLAEAATIIEDERALTRYLRQFSSPPFIEDLTAAVKANEPGEGRVIGLAVIEISCDEPPSATVTEEEGAFVVTPGKVVAPLPECLVPVTSVAVLDLPA